MLRFNWRRVNVSVFCLAICTAPQLVWGADLAFKVSSTVTKADSPDFRVQNETLFTEPTVFDLVFENGKTVEAFLWDRKTSGFTLLDPIREVTCQVTMEELLQMATQMQIRAEKMPNIVRQALAPNFRVQWDAPRQQLTMTNPQIVYSAILTTPPAEEIVLAYRQFSDVTARLNASRPGALPPNARLSLNRDIFRKHMIPKSVTVTLEINEGRPAILQSHHHYDWTLSEKDREQIEMLFAWREAFAAVDLPAFHKQTEE